MRKFKSKYKVFLLKRREKNLSRRKKHIEWRVSKNKSKQGISIKNIRWQKSVDKSVLFIAPKIFSLRDNAEGVLRFISELKKHKNRNQRVFIQLKNVQVILNGSIALLLSVIQDLSRRNIVVIGDSPRRTEPRKAIEKSGFFNYVRSNFDKDKIVSPDTIITKGLDIVQQEATAEAVMTAMKTVSGKKIRNQPIQGMLIELMANSVNHAFPYSKNKNWILAVNHNFSEKVASFCFVDNGAGVIKTLNLNLRQKIRNFFNGNIDLLETAFEGEIGSRTGLKYRGRGLPSILKKFRQNYFAEFVVITNDVFIDFQNKRKYQLNNAFQGTFYYWELNHNCLYYDNDIKHS